MNRKERRKAAKTHPADVPSVQALFAEGAGAHHAGQLDRAEQAYRTILKLEPGHADSLHRLGVIAFQRGDQDLAEKTIRQAIARNPAAAPYHAHLGLVLAAAGKAREAQQCCRQAMMLDPAAADVPNTLGLLLLEQGAFGDAVEAFRKSIALQSGWPETYSNLGDALLALGRFDEARDAYRQALALAPDFAAPHAGLAQLSHAAGDHGAALQAIQRALAADDSFENRKIFVQCVKDLRLAEGGRALRPLLLRALDENWCRPEDLALVVADLVRVELGDWKSAADGELLSSLARDQLLTTFLRLAPNQDLALEHILTRARRILLRHAAAGEDVPEGLLAFQAALAQQCFLNEYVFACEEEELLAAQALRDRLADPSPDGSLLLAVASYFPLPERLAKGNWQAAVAAVMTQQIAEPLEEARLRSEIPHLTETHDLVSRQVQAQYSENPYPRWVRSDPPGPPQSLPGYMRRQFPLARIKASAAEDVVDILVAGCGTGRNAIEATERFKQANTLAIDLSLASLAHAMRKSKEAGTAIAYAQADILELAPADRRFDLIEAVGVLHHLGDPLAGWRRLLSFLKPGGFMNLGLYSKTARQDVAAARSFLSGRGLGAHDISEARRCLMAADSFATIMERPDFYTTSNCRDLLFHVCEHQLDLGEIAKFLQENGLSFLGFWAEASVLAAYQRRFPDDPAAVDLDHWQTFEAENPHSFSGMYQFWVQKPVL